MKKLLFILFAVIAFASCTEQTVQKSNLPIEVVKLKENNSFDTTYCIKTEKNVYIFDNEKEYQGEYSIENEEGSLFFAGLFLGLFIVLLIVAAVVKF